jgi:hypothetical protein
MQRRMLAVAALASMAAAGPIAGAEGAASKAKALAGVVFGGTTTQDYPIVIELDKTGRKVAKLDIALDLTCQTPDTTITIPDGIDGTKATITVSKTGRFSAQQPVTRIPADAASGTPALDVSASITGRINAKKTSIKGSWERKVVFYDPTDPTTTKVLESCDSGSVRYSAKQ